MANNKTATTKKQSAKIQSNIEDQETPTSPVATVVQAYKRNMSGTKEIFTDLFKLMSAVVVKYEGWNESEEHPETHPNKFSHWEHTHPFRTFDKKGERMSTCTPIGGHFHIIEWEENEDPEAPPVIKSVSGPKVMQKQRIRGRTQMVAVDANDYDGHTHDVEYIRSGKIQFSTTNVEAAKVVAFEASKTAPLQGVTER